MRGGGVKETGDLFERRGLLKLKYKKLEVTQPRITNKSKHPAGKPLWISPHKVLQS